MKLVVDNTRRPTLNPQIRPDKKRAIALIEDISDVNGGNRLLRGMLQFFVPQTTEGTVKLMRELVESLEPGQLETALRVLESCHISTTAARN